MHLRASVGQKQQRRNEVQDECDSCLISEHIDIGNRLLCGKVFCVPSELNPVQRICSPTRL